jgi:predicted nucleotidyltransferase
MPLRDEIVALAREVLERHHEIELAVLFGSWARDDAHAHSDVDLAIAWRREAPPLGRELALQAELERALGRDVDLVGASSATGFWCSPATRRRGIACASRSRSSTTTSMRITGARSSCSVVACSQGEPDDRRRAGALQAR